jgi:hypothetical protein
LLGAIVLRKRQNTASMAVCSDAAQCRGLPRLNGHRNRRIRAALDETTVA